MILNKETAKKTAELLLQINAIKLQPNDPFTWASGWKSPIYCDNRITLSFPMVRTFLREQLAKQIEEVYGKPDVIAGVATGAIGIGALVAEELGLPFVYVRPKAKAHGRQNQIAGMETGFRSPKNSSQCRGNRHGRPDAAGRLQGGSVCGVRSRGEFPHRGAGRRGRGGCPGRRPR